MIPCLQNKSLRFEVILWNPWRGRGDMRNVTKGCGDRIWEGEPGGASLMHHTHRFRWAYSQGGWIHVAMLQTGLRPPAEGEVLLGPCKAAWTLSVYTISCEMRDRSLQPHPPSSGESGQLSASADLCDPELSQEDSPEVA